MTAAAGADLAALAARLHATAGDVATLPKRQMVTAVRAVKAVAADEAGRAGSPWRAHRTRTGKARRAVVLRARDRMVTADARAAAARVQGVPVGPWVWATSGTRGHLEGVPKGVGAGPLSDRQLARARRRRPWVRVGGSYRTPPIRHPGSRGRGSWKRVTERAAKVVPAVFADALADTLEGVTRG